MSKTNSNISKVNNFVNTLFSQDKIGINKKELWIQVGDRELIIENLDRKSRKIYVLSALNGMREVQYDGQQTRVAELINAITNHEDGKARGIAISLMDFNMRNIPVDIFIESNGKVKLLNTFSLYRRDSYITSKDKLVLLIKDGDNVEEVLNKIRQLEDLSSDDQKEVEHVAIQEGVYYQTIIMQVQSHIGDSWNFLGGNPDNGLLLFTKTKLPVTVAAAQKLAKIKLSGGIFCDKMPITFKAKTFDETFDGHFAIIANGIADEFNERNSIGGIVYQSRTYKNGEYAIKGTLSTPVTKKLEEKLGDETAIIDVNEYNKTFGKQIKEDQLVTIDNFCIVGTDAELGERSARLSYQLINRAPESVKSKLHAILKRAAEALKNEAKNNPTSFLPDFGIYKMMKSIKPIQFEKMDYKKSATEELNDRIKELLSKGPKIDGMYLYNVASNGLAFDEVLISRNVAKKKGIKIGDRINLTVYPALLSQNKSSFVFSKKVVGFLNGNTISMSHQANLVALRDYDGDKIIAFTVKDLPLFPEQDSAIYSAILKGVETIYTEMLKSKYSNEKAIEAFTHYGSSVGKIDVRIETLSKAIDLSVEQIAWLNKCEQADIESKKHATDTSLTFKALTSFIKSTAPQLLNSGKFVKHEDIAVRKAKDDGWKTCNTKKMTPEIADLVKIAKSIKLGQIETQTANAFRMKAARLFVDLGGKFTDDIMKLKNQVIDFIYGVGGDIEYKKAMIYYAGRDILSQIGYGAFYLLVIALMVDDVRLKSIFFPMVFAGHDVLQDIDKVVVDVFANNKINNVYVETRSGDKLEFEKRENTVRIFRSKDNPCIVNDEPIVNVGDEIIYISQTQLRVVGGDIFSVNAGKSVGLISGNKYSITKVSTLTGKDGKTVISGLDIEVE